MVLKAPATSNLSPYPIHVLHATQELSIDLSDGKFPAAVGGVVTLSLAALPELSPVGGSITGHAKGVPFPLLVLRVSTTEFRAYNARCPHLGCAVSGAKSLLICKCHGSLFALDGKVKLGPAREDLKLLDHTTFDLQDTVVVTIP